MPKKKDMTVKDALETGVKIEKPHEKKKPGDLSKTIKGKLEFKRMSSYGDLGFDINSDGVLSGKKIAFYSFLPSNFRDEDLVNYEITGSVTYKINIKKK